MKALMTVPRLLRKSDLFWILLLLAAAVLGTVFLSAPQGNRAVVRVEGETVQTIPLTEEGDYSFENRGISLTVTVEDQTARIAHSDCPDRICVNAGPLSQAGSTAVCLPANLSLTIEGADAGYDGITY